MAFSRRTERSCRVRLRGSDDDIPKGDAIANQQLFVWNDCDCSCEDKNTALIGEGEQNDVWQTQSSFCKCERVGQDFLCTCGSEGSYTGTCYGQTQIDYETWQNANACRRTDRCRREAEALIARKYIRQDIVKEVKGKRAAGRIAAWADVCDELDGTDCKCKWNAERNGYVRYESVHGRLAIAVAYWEDWWALWRERNWWATERRSRRRYRNAVRTRRAEFRQYFQFHFCFYLDFHANDDIELNHTAEEDASGWIALKSADPANDIVLIKWFRQAQNDFLVELHSGCKGAERRSICEYSKLYSRSEDEMYDTYPNGGSTNYNVFAADSDNTAGRAGSNRLNAGKADILPGANSCVYQCSTIVGKGNLVPVAVSENNPVVHLVDADTLFLQVIRYRRSCGWRRCRELATHNGLHVMVHRKNPSFPRGFALQLHTMWARGNLLVNECPFFR